MSHFLYTANFLVSLFFLSCHPLSLTPLQLLLFFFFDVFILPLLWERNNQVAKLAGHGQHGSL